MKKTLNKSDRAQQFRTRLTQALSASEHNQSTLARAIGADRSTVSQALTGDGARLPGAHVVGACAESLGVSADWLLGLSDRPENAADMLSASLTFSQAPRAPVDERIFNWHREAAGYKIRHVPAMLPDMLKTTEMLDWEYGPHLGRTTTQAINAARDRLDWIHNVRSDYEIAMPLYEIESFVKGTGYYCGLSTQIRQGQIDRFMALTNQLYPRLRIYLFDARRLYASPVTIFGPLLAVFFTGGHYMAFRDRERIETFTNDFDNLIREAQVSARDFAAHLSALV